MSNPSFDALLGRLEKNPENITLRLAILRRAKTSGLKSHALELVLELDPDAVPQAGDRALIASIFADAGLDEDAGLWRQERLVETPEPISSQPTPQQPEHTLRVVGGFDNADPFEDNQPIDDAPLTFADVGGLDDVKRDIERRIIAPFKHAGLLSKFKKRAGGGVLLYGPPGCGKTMIARAMAGEAGFNFLSVGISDILEFLKKHGRA